MKRPFVLLVSLIALFLLAGCGPDGGPVCTQIGCDDMITLTVQLEDGTEVERFSGTVTVAGETIEVSCSPESAGGDGYGCDGARLILYGVSAQEVTVDLQSDDDDSLRFEGTIELDVQEVTPNGEDCPPVCLQSNETVVLEAYELPLPQPEGM